MVWFWGQSRGFRRNFEFGVCEVFDFEFLEFESWNGLFCDDRVFGIGLGFVMIGFWFGVFLWFDGCTRCCLGVVV